MPVPRSDFTSEATEEEGGGRSPRPHILTIHLVATLGCTQTKVCKDLKHCTMVQAIKLRNQGLQKVPKSKPCDALFDPIMFKPFLDYDIMKMILGCVYPDLLCYPILFVISQPFVFSCPQQCL